MPATPIRHRQGRARMAVSALLALVLAAGLTVLTWSAGSTLAHAADEVTGIDVAGHQHPQDAAIDWAQVKGAGHSFVFVKATEGAGWVSPHFASDFAGAATAGLYRGAYHVARLDNTTSNGAAQAEHYVAKVGKLRQTGDLPPVLDFETQYAGDLTPAQRVAWTREWLTTVERLTGRVPIIYTSPSFWEEKMNGYDGFGRYPLWLAHYTDGTPRVPGSWTGWTFWQHTDEGSVPGIAHAVDLNRFAGSFEALTTLATPPPVVVSTALTLGADKSRIRRGKPVRLKGRLTGDGRALPGRTVQVLQRPAGTKRWSVVRRVRTVSGGRLAVALRPRRTTAYRVSFTATESHAASTSRAVRIRVRR
ncbi:glycoside hydrolase family 25 protein [Nocardioides pacificus]